MRPHFLLAYNFPPMQGGLSRWMGELARYYPPGALVVSTGRVDGATASDRALPNSVDRLEVDAGRLRTVGGLYRWSRRLRALCQEHDPGFIWCGNLKPASYPASLTRRKTGVPYGIIVHGTDLLIVRRQAGKSALKRRLARRLLGGASVIIANSRFTLDLCADVCRQIGVERPEGSLRVVPLGTDPAHFRPGIDTRTVVNRYQLDGRRWMMTVANLVPHKGIDVGIRALASLSAQHPRLGYAIIGKGDQRPELERLAASLGVAERVRFLTGVPDEDLPGLYNAASVYVGVSRLEPKSVEGFGISLAEAAACGKPVVGGRSGGVPETVREGETGLLVDPTNHAEVAAAIDTILRDDSRAQSLGRAGRALVERHFNWTRVARDVMAIGQEFAVNGVRATLRQPSPSAEII